MPNIHRVVWSQAREDARQEAEWDKEFDREFEKNYNSVNYNNEFKAVTQNGDIVLDIDIIEYLDMQKNYDEYLRTIYFFGGFMTYEHLIIALSPKYKRTTVFNTINDMVDKGYLRKESLGKYKYVILGKKAQIYVKRTPKANHIQKPNQVKLLSRLLLTDYLLKFVEYLPEKFLEIMYMFPNYEEFMEFKIGMFYIDISSDYKIIKDEELTHISDWEEKEISFAPKFISPKEAIKNQMNLLDSEDIKKGHINGSGATIKKTYDILGKLKLKNVYILGSSIGEEIHSLEILILDIDKDNRWFKQIIEDIDHLICTLYFNAIKVQEKKIKLNFTILTDNENKVNNIQSYLNKKISEMKSKADEFIEINVVSSNDGEKYISGYDRGGRDIAYWEKNNKHKERKVGKYSGRIDPLYIFWVNDIKVMSLNTVRFFETRADNVDIITKDTFKIIDLKDIDNTSEKSLKTMSYEEEIQELDPIYDIPDDDFELEKRIAKYGVERRSKLDLSHLLRKKLPVE